MMPPPGKREEDQGCRDQHPAEPREGRGVCHRGCTHDEGNTEHEPEEQFDEVGTRRTGKTSQEPARPIWLDERRQAQRQKIHSGGGHAEEGEHRGSRPGDISEVHEVVGSER